ncbi:MAG: hypothetical protein WCJ64_19715 [Rhodospirillaceae bacterium]
MPDLEACLVRPLRWRATGDALMPYAAAVAGSEWRLRVNDFPAEPFYTLLIDGREAGDFDDWPEAWQRPG